MRTKDGMSAEGGNGDCTRGRLPGWDSRRDQQTLAGWRQSECTSLFNVLPDPISSPYGGVQFARLLLANAQLTDHVAVAVRIVRFQVIQQAAAFTYQHQKTPPGSMVFLVQLEVFGQLADTLAENRNLHFRATRVTIMGAKARNNFGLLCSCQHGSALLLYVKSSPLSKCLTKNNMASVVVHRKGVREGFHEIIKAAE